MHQAKLELARALIVAACAVVAVPALAQQPIETKSVEGPSERTVRVIQHLAWSQMPAKVEFEGRTVEVDKSDPRKFLIPQDDAQRVITISDRSATAELCEMKEEALANFIAMMNAEEASNRWTREQLHMIKWIYIAVVGIRTGSQDAKEMSEEERKAEAEKAADAPPKAPEFKKREVACPSDLKIKVRSDIERYVTAVNDHLASVVDKK